VESNRIANVEKRPRAGAGSEERRKPDRTEYVRSAHVTSTDLHRTSDVSNFRENDSISETWGNKQSGRGWRWLELRGSTEHKQRVDRRE
jgi:hypothetical protein